MTNVSVYILSLLLYAMLGGLYIGASVGYFIELRYIRGGISAMIALSLVLMMIKTIFGGN